MASPLDAELARFMGRVRARLAAGARDYGDASFHRPVGELVDEIQQEVEDVAGWGLILWLRLDRMREAVDRVAAEGEES